jgi:hypothetical protein
VASEVVAQDAFQDLAGGVARELVDEVDVLGCLESGESASGVGDEFFLGDLPGDDDEGGDGFDPSVVWGADDSDLGDGGVGVEGVLDFA